MNKLIKLTTLGLLPALMIAITAPMTAQAGTLTIYNKDYTRTKNWKTVRGQK